MVQHRDVVASDVVLKADASPRGCLEAENLMLRPHGRWLGISLVCLGLRKTASASPRPSTSLPRSRLGVHLPWLVPTAAALVATATLTPSSLLTLTFTVSGLLSHFTNILDS